MVTIRLRIITVRILVEILTNGLVLRIFQLRRRALREFHVANDVATAMGVCILLAVGAQEPQTLNP